MATWKMKQGYNARLDESLKDRRDESKGMSKKMDGRAYHAVRTMDRHGRFSFK